MSSAPQNSPGSCFRFVVQNADEAARVIREQLGENARVLSVRNVESGGMLGLFSSPKLEVIAQIVAPEPTPEAASVAIGDDPKPVLSELGAASEAVSAGRVRAPRSMIRAPKMTLPELLRRSGFSESLLARLERSAEWRRLGELPLHRALVEVGNHLRDLAAPRAARAPLGRAAFLGTAGVGRTTALCKWLSAEVFRRARIGHVVTAEFDRPNSPGQLPVFCEALGVPLAHFPASTEPATTNAFVYFDLPGLSLRNPAENAAVARFLDAEKIAERVLVLNAAYDHATLRAAYAAGRELGATHVVFTHLDEVAQWGRLWDYLLDGDLEPLFLATGPSLTSDMETDAADAVARRTMPVADESAPPRTPEAATNDDEDEVAAPAVLNTAA